MGLINVGKEKLVYAIIICLNQDKKGKKVGSTRGAVRDFSTKPYYLWKNTV